MPQRTLTALLEAKENITDALENIQEASEAGAEAARGLSEANEEVADDLEDVRNQAKMAQEALEGEGDGAEEAAGKLGVLEKTKESVTHANEELTTAAEVASEALDSESRAITEMAFAADEADEFVDQLRRSGMIATRQMEEMEEALEDVAFSELDAAAAADVLYPALTKINRKLDEVDDQAEEAATGLDRFGISALTTSLNLGPFNFALRNLLTQMPMLIMSAGTLTTVFMGMASAAAAAGLAVAGIFGGGALAMAKGFAENSAEIKNTMQGLQKVMEQVSKMFVKALGPLMNSKSIKMFTGFMEGLAVAVNYVAQSIASMQGLLSNFTSKLGGSFFRHFDEVVLQIERTIEAFLPILARLFEWFMSSLPDAIRFVREKTLELLPALQKFGATVLEFFRAFTELGTEVMQGLLPVLNAVLIILTGVADVILMLPDGLIQFAAAAALASMAIDKLWGVGSNLYRMLGDLHTALFKTSGLLNKLKGVADGIGGPFNIWADAIERLQDELDDTQSTFDDFGSDSGKGILPDGGFDKDRFDFEMPFDTWEQGMHDFADAWEARFRKIRSLPSEIADSFTSAVAQMSANLQAWAIDKDIGLVQPTTDWSGMVPEDGLFSEKAARGRLGPAADRHAAHPMNTVAGFDAAKQRLANMWDQNGRIVAMRERVDSLRGSLARLKPTTRGARNSVIGFGDTLLYVFGVTDDLDRGLNNLFGGLETLSTEFGKARTAAWEFSTAVGSRAKTRLLEFGQGAKMVADNVLGLSGKMSVLQRHWQELGWTLKENQVPGADAFRNISFSEGMGRNERERIDMEEFVHDSQWTPEDKFTWNPTGGLEMETLRAKSFGFGDASLFQGVGKKLSALRTKTADLAFDTVMLASNFDLLKSTLGDTAERYGRLLGVKYQNIRATISEVLASQKLSDSISENIFQNKTLGRVYTWLGDTAIANVIKKYYSLITAQIGAYWTAIKGSYANRGLAASLGAVYESLVTSIGGLYGYITSLLFAESATEELDEETEDASRSILGLGIVSTLSIGPVAALTGALTALAGVLSLIGWTQAMVAIGAILAVAGAAAGALGLMGKKGGELSGVMSFLKDIMDGLFKGLIMVGIPAWQALLDIIEVIIWPFMWLNEVLTMIGQQLGLIGQDGSFIVGLLEALGKSLGMIAWAIGGIADALASVLDYLAPFTEMDEDSLSALEVSKKNVRKGKTKAGKKAGGMLGMGGMARGAQSGKKDKQSAKNSVPKKQKKVVNNTETHEYNFGDFNMKPENKAEVKRLVEDALREANRNRRLRDGSV